MNAQQIHAALTQRFGESILGLTTERCDPFVSVAPQRIAEVCQHLRTDPSLSFDFLRCLTGVDAGEQMTVVYHLFSFKHRHSIVIKASVPRETPELPSVYQVWGGANWFEREEYDLLGIRFTGHPNLIRIMLPSDWVGHPLRKDYVEQPEYHGLSTTRPDLLGGSDA